VSNAIGSIDVVVPARTEPWEISLDISKLLDLAQRHQNWNTSSANVIPIYLGRYDNEGYSLLLRAYEFSPSVPTEIEEVRNNH
jgi:hypothetical protein